MIKHLDLQNIYNFRKNGIVEKFNSLKKVSTSALWWQALSKLKNEYYDKINVCNVQLGVNF